jgi:RNA polymerase sigma-70 factor (ECF subfamily)
MPPRPRTWRCRRHPDAKKAASAPELFRHNVGVAEEGDNALVERSRKGDEAAFRTLCERHADTLRRGLERRMPARLRKRLSVADVMQEAYVTAYQRLGDYEGPHSGSFKRWLERIAEYKLKEAARHHLDAAKRAAAREMSRHQRPDTRAFGGREPTPSRFAEAAETAAAIDAAIDALPEDYRTILRLVHAEGLTTAEAATRMDRSAEAARKLYGRAVSKLSERMERGNG